MIEAIPAPVATLQPIAELAAGWGIRPDELYHYGPNMAKLEPTLARRLRAAPRGRLALVTATTPTRAGEGKTTVAIGLSMALNRMGIRSVVALRQPSQGPTFGAKGGGTGGGAARVLPSEAINLHFTGDIHAVAAAHNLLAALVDNHLHFDNQLGLDPRRIAWRRVLDVDDRSLRRIIVGLGGTRGGIPRESGFDIAAASEIMAVLCLARDLADLTPKPYRPSRRAGKSIYLSMRLTPPRLGSAGLS